MLKLHQKYKHNTKQSQFYFLILKDNFVRISKSYFHNSIGKNKKSKSKINQAIMSFSKTYPIIL